MAIIVAMALSWLCLGVSAQTSDRLNTPVPAPAPVASAEGGEAPTDSLPSAPKAEEGLTVSLLTCSPGPEIYELYGHEAIRVKGEGRDSVWNFGVFNFKEPNFVYRFVKGETDYLCVGYPTEWFLPEYEQRGSRVVEQELNLNDAEARRLLKMLQTNALPQNRKYRYNYVKDNCATRIWRMMENAADSKVVYPDSVRYGTYRNEMRAYNRNYPWYQFGIDLALGVDIDSAINAKDEMFVPVEMERMIGGAHFADGRPVVKATNILVEGVPDATLPPTHWWAGPLFWCIVVSVLLVITGISDLVRKRVTRWVYSLWFLILGLAGCVVTFLVFVSEHEATTFNILILWLNPLQLIMAFTVWKQKRRGVPREMAHYNVAALLVLLVMLPFQVQQVNIAAIPLIGATWFLSLCYAIIARKDSYNYYRSRGSFKTRLP